jgi:hypothetical protein
MSVYLESHVTALCYSQYKTPPKLVYMFLLTLHNSNLLTDRMTVLEQGKGKDVP